ncbi:MAG: CPBP family intramembrane metalloprotease [Gemmataceae bacterium]|nr:CPBP family intramembrane metalloprotease [Gemmataceae bacterium]
MDDQAPQPPTPVPIEPLTPLPVPEPILEVLPVPQPPSRSHLGFWLGLLGATAGYIGLLCVEGETQRIALAGLQPLPFLLLALLAYVGVRRPWAQILTVCYLLLLLSGVGLMMVVVTVLLREDWQGIGGTVLGLFLALALAGLCFVPAVRHALARVLPLDSASFVHATALATVVGLTVVCLVPLLTLGEPPLLLMLQQDSELSQDFADEGSLRDEVYGLLWLVPATFLAVGYPLTRNLRETQARLGLVWPSVGQVGFALGAAGLLVLLMAGVDEGITWLWQTLAWPTTDTTAVTELFKASTNPIGAVVIGVTAGLGEELAVRGLLQPRLGILLSNLFFTALHAFQYHFDALLSVFLTGLILGVIRQRSNTTTSAIVHGGYDFVVVLFAYFEVKGFH